MVRRIVSFLSCIAFLFTVQEARGQLSIEALADSVKHYANVNEQKSYDFAQEALRISRAIQDTCGVLQYRAVSARFDQVLGLEQSIAAQQEVWELMNRQDCSAEIKAQLIVDLGCNYRVQGRYNKAVEVLRQGMEVTDSPSKLFRLYNQTGNCYAQSGQIDSSVQYLLKAFDIADQLNSNSRSVLLNNICTVYNDNGFPHKAKTYCNRCRQLAEQDGNDYAYGLATNTMACIYNDFDKRDSARLFIKDALAMDLPLQARHYSYLELGRIEEYDEHYAAAAENYQKAIDIAVELEYPFEESYARSNLANIYICQERYRAALEESQRALDLYATMDGTPQELVEVYERHLLALAGSREPVPLHVIKEHLRLIDTVFNENKRALIVDIEEKYQNEKLRSDQLRQDRIIATQRWQLWGAGIFIGLLGLFAYMRYREAKKRRLLNDQLRDQKDQILHLNQELNHRVKNNLAFMISLLQMQGRRVASEEAKDVLKDSENRLEALSQVHAFFDKRDGGEVDMQVYLGKVIHHLQQALQRPDKAIHIDAEIAPVSLDANTAMRLGLVLNELITNSVKHVDASSVDIDVSLSKQPDEPLRFRYRDNGPGIQPHLSSVAASQSMGLQLISVLEAQLQDKVHFDIS